MRRANGGHLAKSDWSSLKMALRLSYLSLWMIVSRFYTYSSMHSLIPPFFFLKPTFYYFLFDFVWFPKKWCRSNMDCVFFLFLFFLACQENEGKWSEVDSWFMFDFSFWNHVLIFSLWLCLVMRKWSRFVNKKGN